MKNYLLLLFFLLSHCLSYGQKWDKTYGYPGTDESFRDVIETYDHGYLICSSYEQMNGTWLIKTDINGEVIWEKIITWDIANLGMADIYQSQNGSIVLASAVTGNYTGFWPIITKLDSCGNKVWCRVFQDENFNYGWFDDVLILDNGDIVALAYLDSDEEIELVFLYYIDADGNLVWREGYASREDYSLIRSANGDNINKFGDKYVINGDCYYPYPTDTTHFYLRPLFIMLDSNFNEEWIIPFGVNDSILGEAYDVINLSETTFMGVGTRLLAGSEQNSLLMFFNKNGDELGYNQIFNDSIDPDLVSNVINDIDRINDSLFITSTNFGFNISEYPWGEMIIDTSGKIYNKEIRNSNTSGWSTLVKTFDDKYVIGTGLIEAKTDWDIYMYKINEDLEHDTIYPGNYTYDSLCPYQIQSGEIDISDCLIITDVREVPTPQEYYAGLQSIPIKAFPNPVNGSEITFEFQNTEHHQDMELRCFNVFGNLVHTEKVYQFQGESKINVDSWQQGMYIALIYSNGKVVGQCKFVVR